MSLARLSTGVGGLDELLGGGLIPGGLTVVSGATGIGKTQLGLQFAHAGLQQEGRRGIVFDMNARIDSQSHATYAERMFGWPLDEVDANERLSLEAFFDSARPHGDYLHVFHEQGRRVQWRDLDFDGWHDWQAELAERLQRTIAFFYGNFTQGVRRAVVDGIEPADRHADSIQFELFEYVYQQILRKESTWVARDLFREQYRAHATAAEQHAYDRSQVAGLLLCTSHETMLDELVERKLDDGDLAASANTVIYMGKIREGTALRRALCVAKHRGSACSDDVATFRIGEHGLEIE